MRMTRDKKAEVVQELVERLKASPNIYLTDFTGVAVKPMTELRRKLRSSGIEYRVVKNTLAIRALKEASVEGLEGGFAGPTAFVFAGERPVLAAKVLAEFQKQHETMALKMGLVEGRSVGPDAIKRIATLPPREELLSQMAGALQAPLQGFLGALQGMLYQFVGVVEALRADRSQGQVLR